MSIQLARRARQTLCSVALSLGAFWLVAASSVGHSSASERKHTVGSGQNLVGIARRYGVTVWSLAAANALKPDELVREGLVLNVPDAGAVYVNEGQTLWSVARRHHVSVEALASCNGIKPTASLRPGTRLKLPGHGGRPASPDKARGGSRDWGQAKRPGRVTLVRVATKKSLTVTVAGSGGRVRPGAAEQLAHFLKPRDSRRTKRPQRRLLSLIARASDHFGGRALQVISGYRLAKGYTTHESRHVKGAAMDFRIEGVPNRVLCDYLRQFDDVGVGYYPNSSFVHFDVRDRNAYWIDLSGAGQKPHYLQRAERNGYEDAVREFKDIPIDELVEAAIEDMQHGEPAEDDESDDE